MHIREVRLVYFSPTGTTRTVLEGIARGIPDAATVHVDLTPPSASAASASDRNDVLTVIGAPVYGGRLPVDAASRLRRLTGHHAPAVVVVVYGNRAYDDALLELRSLAAEQGFVPVAAGAFIGEHSYSTPDLPVAPGRPDAGDLGKAEQFGWAIDARFRGLRSPGRMIDVPGHFPYRERMNSPLAGLSPETDEAVCGTCGDCVAACPTGAVTLEDSVQTDKGACIRCCACVKACPTGARTMGDPRVLEVAQWLNENCRERKEPETYL